MDARVAWFRLDSNGAVHRTIQHFQPDVLKLLAKPPPDKQPSMDDLERLVKIVLDDAGKITLVSKYPPGWFK